MEKSDLEIILDEQNYSWIKVEKYRERDIHNRRLEWRDEYALFMQHHVQETKFLIEMCRTLAKELQTYKENYD